MEKQKNNAGDVERELQEAEKLNPMQDEEVVTSLTFSSGSIYTLLCC